MLMSHFRTLHEKAAKLSPIELSKPTSIAVAVLKENRKLGQELTADDFLWIKCTGVYHHIHAFNFPVLTIVTENQH